MICNTLWSRVSVEKKKEVFLFLFERVCAFVGISELKVLHSQFSNICVV